MKCIFLKLIFLVGILKSGGCIFLLFLFWDLGNKLYGIVFIEEENMIIIIFYCKGDLKNVY